MQVVSFFSRKGGVGRTIFAANLASIFSEQGLRVGVLEFDPQNTLSQHFDNPNAHSLGWANTVLHPQSNNASSLLTMEQAHWSPRDNLRLFSFGVMSAAQRRSVEHVLAEQPQWLSRALGSPAFADLDLLLIDTPSGYSVFSDQAERVSTAALSIWLCDAASQKAFLASEPRLLANNGRHRHLINQINASKGSRRELMRRWRDLVGDELLPLPVHQDELVSDALSEGTTVAWFASYSQAAHDLQGVANWMREAWFDSV